MPTALLFPGQASQTPDMRDRVAVARPDLLAAAAAAVGEDPFPRAGDGTRFAQPAIFCASLAGLATLDEHYDAVAGHSLGEVAALVAAGALTEADGLALVALRGRLMERAGAGGGMLAVLGGGEDVEALAERHGVAVANDNAPGQLVLSGDRTALRALAAEARHAGLKTIALGVSGAFHSPAMAPAAGPFAGALAATAVVRPRLSVYSSVTGEPVADPDEIRRLLVEGLTAPVRWRQTVLALHAAGFDRFAEAGPGHVLARLVRRTLDAPTAARA